MLLLLSRFRRVRLCATPQTAARQAPYPIPGILQARTLEWVAISFSNVWKGKVKVKPLSHVRLGSDPMNCSLPGSSIHGIFQTRVLEWVTTAFSITNIFFQYRSLQSTEFPVLFSRTLLVIHFILSSVYMSIPISQFIPSCSFKLMVNINQWQHSWMKSPNPVTGTVIFN